MIQKLILYPDTFLWIKNKSGLIYNSKNFSLFEFKVTDSIAVICSKLLELGNLYMVEMDMLTLNRDEQSFINKIISAKCGELSNINASTISLPPLLNIQKDINKLANNKYRGIEEDILKYFTSLTIQVGGIYKNNDYYRQTIYPANNNNIITIDTLSMILQEYITPYLTSINIVIPQLSKYDCIKTIARFLESREIDVCIYTSTANLDSEYIQDIINAGIKIKLIYDSVELASSAPLNNLLGLSYKFIIKNIDEYNIYNELVQNLSVDKYEIVPIFDNNMDFFLENVFLSKNDLSESKLQRREIFIHQAINSNFFGNLIIMPNGNIYSNVNCSPIGKISDSIYDIILRELEENHSWRLTRVSEPCSECVWQWICPSPSNYEFVIGENYICKIISDGSSIGDNMHANKRIVGIDSPQ